MKVVLVVEDNDDLAMLVELQLSLDDEFQIVDRRCDVAGALEAVSGEAPDLIILDHKLEGELTGLEGSPLLKLLAPNAKIILFTASEELRLPADDEPAIDAFLLKTQMERLLPLSRRLLDLP